MEPDKKENTSRLVPEISLPPKDGEVNISFVETEPPNESPPPSYTETDRSSCNTQYVDVDFGDGPSNRRGPMVRKSSTGSVKSSGKPKRRSSSAAEVDEYTLANLMQDAYLQSLQRTNQSGGSDGRRPSLLPADLWLQAQSEAETKDREKRRQNRRRSSIAVDEYAAADALQNAYLRKPKRIKNKSLGCSPDFKEEEDEDKPKTDSPRLSVVFVNYSGEGTTTNNTYSHLGIPMPNNTSTPVKEKEELQKQQQEKEIKEPASNGSCSNYPEPPESETTEDEEKPPGLWPPGGRVARYLTLFVLFWLAYGNIWATLKEHVLPGSHWFAVVYIVLLAWVGGEIFKKLRLPPLLGMMVVGFVLRNIPGSDEICEKIDPRWSSVLRNCALAVILTRAGMGLDIVKLKMLGWVCGRVAIFPCFGELVGAALAAHFFLGMPWLWALMLGSVLSGLAPAVVVPGMLNMQTMGYGVDKGIPTMAVAKVSVDDAVAVAAFGIIFGVTFAEGSLIMTIIHGPLEVIMGIAYGVTIGIIQWYLPHKDASNVVLFRFLLLLTSTLFCVYGSNAIDYGGAGAIGCLINAFVAAHGWRKEGLGREKDIAYCFAILWLNLQPILFGLIGTAVVLDRLKGGFIGLGIATLLVGLLFRCVVAILSLQGGGFNFKEKLFIMLTGIPKATVQAAIGPVALDTAIRLGLGEYYEHVGMEVMTIAALSILITAPLGAALIAILGPRFLEKAEMDDDVNVEDFAE